MASTEVERNSGASLRVTFYADGAPVDADGSVTVTVTSDSGTAIATNATATHVAPAGSGTYSYSLQPRADLDHIRLDWSGTFSGVAQTVTTYADIVGGYYVTLADIRGEANLSDTAKFPTAKLVAARRWFETLAERHCNQAFVPRYRRWRSNGMGTTRLALPDGDVTKVLWVKDYLPSYNPTGAGTLSTDTFTVSNYGFVDRYPNVWTAGSNNVEVAYEHGMESCPDDIAQAALIAIRDRLLNDYSGRPMLSIADGAGGTTRFAMPGEGRPTGIPDVDVVLNGYRIPAVA